jgi:hypothetical protein
MVRGAMLVTVPTCFSSWRIDAPGEGGGAPHEPLSDEQANNIIEVVMPMYVREGEEGAVSAVSGDART